MKQKNVLACSLVILPIFFLGGSAFAAQAPAVLTVVVDAVAAAKTPLYLAEDSGIFKKYGLDARVVYIRGATLAVQAGIGGEADVLDADEGSVILSSLQTGPKLKIIGSLVNTFPFKVVGKPELAESPRGGRYGMSRFGSPSDFALRLFAKSKGLNPDKDIRIMQIGGQPDRLAALQTGIVDASVFQEPEASILISKGFKVIHDFATKPIPYPFTGFSAPVTAIRTRRPVVLAYLKAMTEALHLYKCDKKTALASMGKGLRTTRSLSEAYDMMLGFYPQTISPNRDALKAALAVFTEVRPDLAERAKTFDIDSVADYSLMQDVLADPAMKPFLGACHS
ncbi:MAG: ABC transporter substrate-binding protein [Alphaproteobacteria bacterium]